MDPTTLLAGITTAFQGLKTVSELIKANKQIEAAKVVADVQVQMGDLSGDLMRISQENLALSKENADLRERLEFKAVLEWVKPFYRTKSGDGPFCPKCWDDEKKAIRLDGPHHTGYKRWDCPKCKNQFMENPNWSGPVISRSAFDDE